MSICPGFWDWLLYQNTAQTIASIAPVKQELERGNDDLAAWAKNNSDIFIPVSDETTQNNLINIMEYIKSLTMLKDCATDEFANGADPWLIAKAMTINATVVTLEKLNLENRRKILIPNICKHFAIECIDTFDLLDKLHTQFVLHKG